MGMCVKASIIVYWHVFNTHSTQREIYHVLQTS